MNAGHYFIIYSCIWPDILEKGWGMDCTALSLNLEKIILKYIERNKKMRITHLGLIAYFYGYRKKNKMSRPVFLDSEYTTEGNLYFLSKLKCQFQRKGCFALNFNWPYLSQPSI